jgi:hypothetical protein
MASDGGARANEFGGTSRKEQWSKRAWETRLGAIIVLLVILQFLLSAMLSQYNHYRGMQLSMQLQHRIPFAPTTQFGVFMWFGKKTCLNVLRSVIVTFRVPFMILPLPVCDSQP